VIVETLTFRLRPGADEAAFLAADKRVQAEAVPNRPGFLRRTTARGHDGGWIVITLWEHEPGGDDGDGDHPAERDLMALVDGASVERARYTTLD
jgi:hypothetical protein